MPERFAHWPDAALLTRLFLNPHVLWILAALTVAMALPPAHGGEAAPPTPTPERLGGKERILSFLSTDKPIYKPGEKLYARATALHADSYFPVRHNGKTAWLTITGPRDEEIVRMPARLTDSTAGFSWAIPAAMAGGRYKAKVEVDGGAPAVRPFEIRVYTPPRLKSQIEFLREGYGPGDTVTAVASIARAEGGIPAGAKITALARIDGVQVALVPDLTVDESGACRATFVLPERMERGEGSLAFVIEDGGVTETATKTIPILLQTLDIAFFPEGGELVAGLPGRVYVQARRPDGKPADLTGDIVRADADYKAAIADSGSVGVLRTEHEGRGIVAFTPDAGERYALRISQPSGIDRLFPLPPVRDAGAVIRAEKQVYAFDEPIRLGVQATPGSNASLITLYHREKMLAKESVASDGASVDLDAGDAEGVLIATVWDASGKPLAERLIFRRPKFAVRVGVDVETDPAGGTPTPGGKVRLKIVTTDENGRPVEAVVGLTVTDDALLEMVEKRDQAPGLPVMAYLENEVMDLADAHVYFDVDNSDAARDVDLLLGTQGWRRFVLVRLDEALKEHPEAVCRALAMRMLPPPTQTPVQPLPIGAARFGGEEKMALAFAPAPEPELFLMMDNMVEEDAGIGALQQEIALDNAVVMLDVEEPAVMPARIEQGAAPRMEAAKDMERMEPAPFLDMRKRQDALRKPVPHVILREYAHQARPGRRPNDRVDFTETIYWNAGIRTNPRDGVATVSFDLSDSVTTFRVRADAFGNNGALGEATAELASVEPFYIEPKFPSVVVAGDRVDIPVVLVNSTAGDLERPGLVARCEGLEPIVDSLPAGLGAGSRERVMVRLTADKAGEYDLSLNAAASGYADSVSRKLTVLPRGFPVQQAASGLIGPEKPYAWQFVVADDVLQGSMRVSAKIHPTPLANMQEALNALLRQPYGCFEQTSSTSYPLVMAQQYFLSHAGVSPDAIRKAGELLEESYKRLVGFECSEKGYEWFGGDPGHEALTAYGLMQFTEMKKVMPVNDEMIIRTRDWLLARRDGKGGFKRNERALDSFGAAPVPLTNLYILWTLLESGEKPETLTAEIEAAKKLVAETKDPYLLALGANVLYLAGDLPAARAAATAVRAKQDKDGSLPGAETSITRSGGESLGIETASFAVLAWLRCGEEYAGAVEKTMAWLFECCKSGRFGTTQSTILALKAINAYDAARAKPKAPGSVQLVVDGKPFGHALPFDDKAQGALELPDFSAALTPGGHKLELLMTGGGEMPFALTVEYNTPQPANSPDCPLSLTTMLSARTVKEGELVDLTVKVSAGNADVSMPLAIIGLPAGVEPRHERLKEMVAGGQMAAYEIIGRELVLYWRAFKAEEERTLSIPLVAQSPGMYTAPASRVYAYYLDEHKQWAAGETVEVQSR